MQQLRQEVELFNSPSCQCGSVTDVSVLQIFIDLLLRARNDFSLFL